MAIGKNARKREARKAFHADQEAGGKLPFAFNVVEYRDGKRRVITFASLTSYKEYRERFYPEGAKGRLILESDLSLVDDSNKDAMRASVTNKGIGLGNEKRFSRVKSLVKGDFASDKAKGKAFGKSAILGGKTVTLATTGADVWQSQECDRKRKELIAERESGIQEIDTRKADFEAMRRRCRERLRGL